MKSKIQIFIASAFMLVMLSVVEALAQVPQLFNYQGIARDAKGNPLTNQTMTLKLSVLPTSDASVAEYEETQTVKTNEFGLYTLQIGNGTAVSGNMKTVKWETGNKYIKVGIDPIGGTNFVYAGTNQLLSVPYAIYADKAGVAANAGNDKTRTGAVNSEAAHVAGDNRYLTRFYGLNLIGKSALYESATGNIGLGTTAPGAKFSLYTAAAGVVEHIRMQDVTAAGAGRFVMYNDNANAYATFTKYGTTYAGGYPGVASSYPYANLLAFGNNGSVANDGTGRFLISSGGNIGISIAKAGSSKLKFHADFASENVGIGGNSVPVARVHLNNTDGTNMDLRLTNNTTLHTVNDGLNIAMTGNNANMTNKENANLVLGTNNTDRLTIDGSGKVGIGTNSPAALLHVNGDVHVNGRIYAPGHVVQTIIATSETTSFADWNSFQEVDSNYRVTITPAFANSILLIEYSFLINNAMNPNTIFQMQLVRDIAGTAIPVGVGPANGLRSPVTYAARPGNGYDVNDVMNINMVAKDTVQLAGTPVTYGFKYRQETGGAGTTYFNYSFGNSAVYGWSGLMTMKVTEIAQ